MKSITRTDFYWMLACVLVLSTILSIIQNGAWLSFFALLFIALFLLTISIRWASENKTLIIIVILAFMLRFAGGVGTYLALPVFGYTDEDDQAGYIYTDAHRRDDQAWQLAQSSQPIINAFNEKFAYDQYGGLLAFSAFIYRYFSPDLHRPLLLILISAFMGAIGIPFLWKALTLQFDEKLASTSAWIFALYPESILLGGSAMREPYLLACSAFIFWGFICWKNQKDTKHLWWLALGILGMLLISPSIALVTLIILAGWYYFENGRGQISWWLVIGAILVFFVGLLLLSSALTRGNIAGDSPFAVINNFVREALKWNVYKVEEESGWVQKLFEEMPAWLKSPFVMVYGFLQPVLPAILIVPTTSVWKVIGILRAVGWYALMPLLILSPLAGASLPEVKRRKVILWLSFVIWAWILFTALRGGGDQWDNPRYRVILLLWQAIVAGQVWLWWRASKNLWFVRVLVMQGVLVLVFANWYLERYVYIGFEIPFSQMLAIIVGGWLFIIVQGVWQDRKK